MSESRLEQLRAQIEEMSVESAGSSRDRPLAVLGGIAMAAGVLLTIVAYVLASSQASGDLGIDNLEQNEALALGLIGVAATVAGAALFLRYSLSQFFRFWLLRQLYAGQANTAELIQSLGDNVDGQSDRKDPN